MHVVRIAFVLAGCTDGGGCTGDGSAAPPPPTDDPLVSASGEITCTDPTARELDPQERIVYGIEQGWTFAADWREDNWDLRWGGRGIVVADFDGDGLLDIVAPQTLEPTRLLLGAGGTFVEHPLPDVEGVEGAVGGSAADFDGDGDMDVFLYGLMRDLTGSPEAGVPPVLLLNDGTATFTGTSHPEWEDPDLMGCGGSGSWADFDLDGDLDLFYGRLGLVRDDVYVPCPKRLLENQGDGTFLDVADQHFGADLQQLRVLASGWHPAWDEDAWPELYVVADAILEGSDPELAPKGMSDMLYDNGPEGGLERMVNGSLDIKLAGMGLAAEDVNGDGLVDVMVPGVAELPLLVSAGGGIWVDQSLAWGSTPDASRGQSSGWGGEFADLDNDGLLDLVLTFGSFASWSPEPDEIFRRTGAETFEQVGEAWGFADGEPNRGVLVVDLDANGWLDIVKREIGGVVFVDVANCGDAAWMEVFLDGPSMNRFGVGATVRVTVGDIVHARTITAGSTSFASGGPPMAHFGLGSAAEVDAIEVVWPDGDTITTHGPQLTRQILHIAHPDGAP